MHIGFVGREAGIESRNRDDASRLRDEATQVCGVGLTLQPIAHPEALEMVVVRPRAGCDDENEQRREQTCRSPHPDLAHLAGVERRGASAWRSPFATRANAAPLIYEKCLQDCSRPGQLFFDQRGSSPARRIARESHDGPGWRHLRTRGSRAACPEVARKDRKARFAVRARLCPHRTHPIRCEFAKVTKEIRRDGPAMVGDGVSDDVRRASNLQRVFDSPGSAWWDANWG
jgi:hypothetical protein